MTPAPIRAAAPGGEPGDAPTGATVAAALLAARTALARDPQPAATARFLLGGILGLDAAGVLARRHDPLDPAHRAAFDAAVRRVAQGEPLAYVLGEQPFLDFTLTVTPDVLIPRPETEELALWAIAWAARRRSAAGRPLRAADVGTGSGALAIALARALPDALVAGVDVSAKALAVAAANAARLGCAGRAAFVAGDLLAPFTGSFDLVVANLPYVGTDEVDDVDPAVLAHEPYTALFAGPDGLDLLRRLIADLPAHLAPGGAAALEIGWRQGERVVALAAAAFPRGAIALRKDAYGRPRLVTIEAAS